MPKARIISMTPLQPGAYKALYWEDEFFRTAPVVAIATFEERDGQQQIVPVVIHGGGHIFALAGVEIDSDNAGLPCDPHYRYFEGMHPAEDIARVADSLRPAAN
ncbi:hypothetical protein HUT19_37605 [Streptomyces sp. NA02950]|uniref:hypothetical protein n=1 Tax=Streptomyces sp. NA02950 TaxID=2742137 RepID=UPI00159298B7|nr:hypothetical protein [Streptomyces sp. NA02950]QKV96711.1 hypothetical protein HUT19_37605 [Streptomyces sp. NA02950]